MAITALTMVQLLQSLPARADLVGDAQGIQVWTRQPGSYSDEQSPVRHGVVSLAPHQLKTPLTVKTLMDIQYDRRVTYRGLALKDLISSVTLAADTDLALLHFENGMIVPMPITRLARLNAFLALEVCKGRGRACEKGFDAVPRASVYGEDEDPRPIEFSWNKLVVGSRWHPDVVKTDADGFSPWLHVDSLKGIEFANAAAYYRQFAVGRSGGESVFRARCQFCHAVRFVGASFGWDFVRPLPLAEKRTPATLTGHVKYKKAMATRLGIQMPPQDDVNLPEMTRLWQWMKDLTREPAKAYRP